MSNAGEGNLIWYRTDLHGDIRMAVQVLSAAIVRQLSARPSTIQLSNLSLPLVDKLPVANGNVVYRYPVGIQENDGEFFVDGVYGILTGAKGSDFAGNRSDYRALIQTARAHRKLLYVLPVTSVCDDDKWTGYLRIGRRRWIALPCPQPEAVYNRITLRNLEKSHDAVLAREWMETKGIPLFNPTYFYKDEIYRIVASSPAARYLPETRLALTRLGLEDMLSRHPSVYLKPCGGSIGHGMLRVDREPLGYRVSVLKRGETRSFHSTTFGNAWKLVRLHRLSQPYVIQSGKPLLQWHGRPCDFRVLLQKSGASWHVVGIGVRVAGEGVITTHVPNGGSIVAMKDVLETHFFNRAAVVEQELREAVVEAAKAIDRHYGRRLGEMSMDMAVEDSGRIWFLEANSKPMKFDEPSIRKKALEGIVLHLQELQEERAGAASPL